MLAGPNQRPKCAKIGNLLGHNDTFTPAVAVWGILTKTLTERRLQKDDVQLRQDQREQRQGSLHGGTRVIDNQQLSVNPKNGRSYRVRTRA